MRGYESAVQVDCENVALRRMIENLQHKSLTTNAKHDETLRTFNEKFKKLTKLARDSLGDTRQYSEAQMLTMAAKISQVREHVATLGDLGLNTEGDLAGTIEAKNQLEKVVEQLKAEIVEINQSKKSEKERMEATILQLRNELADADARHTLDEEKYSELRMETDTLTATNAKLVDEIKVLRMWAQKMEMDGLQTVAESNAQRQRLTEQHDNIVGSLLGEASDLRMRMEELTSEVERLQELLARPTQQTHFEKFVDLKKANVKLKGKLNNLAKEHQFNEANGTSGAPVRSKGTSTGTEPPRAFQKGTKPASKGPAMSLQQQVYLAELERERAAAQELQEKKDFLQLYGEHQDVPPMPGVTRPNSVHVPNLIPGRARSRSPINNDDISRGGSPRSLASGGGGGGSARPMARPVNSAGLQIGVPLMGKQTRAALSERVNV